MMGIVLDRAFPTFPHGFPEDVIREFERRIGRRTLGNEVASGPRSSTRSAPSTCTPASRSCTRRPTASFRSPRTKRDSDRRPVPHVRGRLRSSVEGYRGSGRVIARPFVGAPGAFHAHRQPARFRAVRRAARRSSIACARATFRWSRSARSRICSPAAARSAVHTANDDEGWTKSSGRWTTSRRIDLREPGGFRTVYGHRNDVHGYAPTSTVRRPPRRDPPAPAPTIS